MSSKEFVVGLVVVAVALAGIVAYRGYRPDRAAKSVAALAAVLRDYSQTTGTLPASVEVLIDDVGLREQMENALGAGWQTRVKVSGNARVFVVNVIFDHRIYSTNQDLVSSVSP